MSESKKKYFWILFLFWVLTPSAAGAAESIVREDGQYSPIGKYTEYLTASSEEVSLEDILQKTYQELFQPHKDDSYTLGLTSKVLWLRFKLDNPWGEPLVLAIDRPLPYADLYVPQKGPGVDSHWIRRSVSLLHPQGGEREFKYRYPVFLILQDAPGSEYFYLRINPSGKEYHAALSFVPFVEGREHFLKRARKEIAFFFTIFGMLLSLALYNLFIALQLKDKVYFSYVCYLASILIYVIMYSGLPIVFDAPRLAAYPLQAASFVFCFGAVFTQSFLQTKKHTPILHRLITLYFIFCLTALFAIVAGRPQLSNTLVHIAGASSVWLAVITGVRRLLQGYTPARYYVAGWLVVCLGSCTISLQGLGLLPNNFFTSNSVAITCTMEAILLSLALGDRISALQKDKKILQTQEKRLMELSIRDELTGLYNKRWFTGKISSEIETCKSVGQPLSLIILDIDHFKQLNDEHGHAAGDRILHQLGEIIAANVRTRDIPCRYGGEEFAIILPLIDLKKAVQVAERLRKAFCAHRFTIEGGGHIIKTISLGVAELSPSDDAASLFGRADLALYCAKDNGRNRVITA
ncbi:diguanylate cyclase (GGDEF) domain-containing protein [Desulfatibacillum alkenivorans DSM 16219]|uniref:diguanylate cyclase n=1 Tax=Desulfatibacillum alkenivorans DSM 16219 TaxID=1121393 RepID=A0A1M6N1I3_9BACT|nr:diguanylate cyclase [Desulfatibacillum alkenivorans]SHJ89503.1 diguanylate cyclase (GGDEF) domain-containing protein [Desulfatibacillum alkenivorans DSM 16219]